MTPKRSSASMAGLGKISENQAESSAASWHRDLQEHIFFRTDADGKISWFSSSAARTLGFDSASLIGEDLHSLFLFTPGTRKEFFQQLRKSGQINDYVIDAQSRNGFTFPVSVDVSCHYADSGEFAGYEGSWRTAGSLKSNDAALRRSRERFRRAFLNSPDPVSIIRVRDAVYVDVNEGFTGITGLRRSEVVGKSASEVRLFEDEDEQTRLISDLASSNTVLSKDVNFRARDGKTRKGMLSAMTMTFENEPHFLCILKDIDVLKQTEEALEVSEVRFQGLFNQMSSGVAVLSPRRNGHDFYCVDLNPAAERIEKGNRDQLLGKSIVQMMPGSEESGLLAVIRRVWRSGKAEHYSDARYDQGWLLSWRNYFVYKIPSGELILIYDDVTDRKRVEEKLFEYQEQLRVLASELSLAEERERRCIATDLHDQIGQTLSVVKLKLHELREQVTGEDLTGRLEEIGEYVNEAIRDTRSLTCELSPPVLYELGLEAALEWLAEHFTEMHNIVARFKNDGLSKPVGDDIRGVLFRAVRELLVNVVKHARATEVEIAVSRELDYLRIDLTDNGIGFNPKEVFSRVVSNHAFGLFNIRERLEHLGGYLGLDSKPGLGTKATVVAPLDIEEALERKGQ